ncbi:hypothetical protein [Pseudomonas sp. 6D_7.1_Bac1]|uniref:hypothetical protein n=1 Tax=Pseudomonas sp. 6D_7.1_Bac1 TaxID=2971615 RepID=UPI0021C90D7B|nr:hypothetical protein [Pseudomonas sp. 6D_7.1_Bac1]MCU1753113.1 hypothetical protein [Pseudomonas sp. 6D_7.1_Bac1]
MATDPTLETLMANTALIAQAAQRSDAASKLQHRFVHGGADESIPTESGPLPTLSKWKADTDQVLAQVKVIADSNARREAADPTVRADGSPLQSGDEYFNTLDRLKKVYNGAVWYVPNADGQMIQRNLANATDPDTGPNMVGFLQSGTGTQSRTVGDKLRERHSLFDFMAKAEQDDVTSGGSRLNHTAAINRALASGYEIELPDGVLNAEYIELVDGTRAIGKGHIAGRLGTNNWSGTVIRALPSAERKFIRMPAGKIRGVLLEGFTLAGDHVHNPLQDGISLEGVVSGRDGGLWDFELRRLFVKGFAGDGLRLVGGYKDTQAPVQFGQVAHVLVERPVATARSLVLMGQCEHIEFDECRFDGVYGLGPVGVGSYIGRFDPAHDIRPNNITFTNPSFQRASVGIEIDRCENIVMIAPWFETVKTAVRQNNSSVGLELIAPRFANVITGLECGKNCMASIRSPIVAGSISNLVVGSNHSGVRLDSPSKAGVGTSGVHSTVSFNSGRQLEVKAHTFLNVEFGPGLTIETINGYHMPGETLTLLVTSNPVRFTSAGNLALGSLGPYKVLAPGSTITFIRTDAPGVAHWQCIGLV